MKIAVLGAGISGLTLAKRLSEKGFEVVVYEKNSEIGGLARTRLTQGYVYDPHGGHIFNSKHEEIVKWIFSLLPKEKWQYSVRNAKIYFEGKLVSYPFELSLCELDTDLAAACAVDFIQSQVGDEPANFRDWLVWNFGKSIAEYYMLPYNTKIWDYPLEDMETNWVHGKMPLPSKTDIVKSLMSSNSSERKMPHSTFYYPVEGGIKAMVDCIGDGLKIHKNESVKTIKYNSEKYCINGSDEFDRVISTIPLPSLSGAMDLPDKVSSAIADLKYNSLNTALFNCPPTKISWLYIPSKEFKAHRVCYQGALSTKACPSGCSATIEIIGDQMNINSNLLDKNDVVPKDLGLHDLIDFEFTKYAYVIHDKNYRKNTSIIRDYFNSLSNFDLLGRFSNWNYKNMDLCMMDAFNLAEEIQVNFARK